MSIRKCLICLVVFACCVLVTGYGEKMKELTEEEEEIISLYSAKVVAKHNVRLSQGIMRYKGTIEDDTEESAEEDAAEEAPEETAEQVQSDTGDVDTEQPEAEAENAVQPVSLTDAMGMDQITFSFKGAGVPESLRLSSYYTLPDPAPGKEYVIVTYEVRNASDTAREVSIVSLRPVFTAEINGESSTAGIVLEDDLSTYEGVIDAGGSEDLIILFEVSDEAAADLSEMNLYVDVNGTNYPLIL